LILLAFAAGSLLGCGGGGPGMTLIRGWVQLSAGDCSANDQSYSAGSDVPLSENCTTHAQNELGAICWDQTQYVNPAMAGPWCTYKPSAVNILTCTGGP